jgi:acyl carrier protein
LPDSALLYSATVVAAPDHDSVPVEVVRTAVATLLGVTDESITANQRLGDDLLLTSLDVIEIIDHVGSLLGAYIELLPQEPGVAATVATLASRLRAIGGTMAGGAA